MRAVVVYIVDGSQFTVNDDVSVHTDWSVVNVEDWWSCKLHLLVYRLRKWESNFMISLKYRSSSSFKQ